MSTHLLHAGLARKTILVWVLGCGVLCWGAVGCKLKPTRPGSTLGDPGTFYLEPVEAAVPGDPFAQPEGAAVFATPAEGVSVGSATPGSTYQVKKGDTLWSIAARVYGKGQRWKDIAAANPGIDPNRVKSGQVINLPQ